MCAHPTKRRERKIVDVKLDAELSARANSQELHELTVPLGQPGGESKLGRFLSEHLAAH
jgi:hypothetical protein